HADCGIEALNRNVLAVVEKPLATNFDQYERLRVALEKNPGKLFSCFHKRFLPFNDFIYQDLQAKLGEPISCFCVVYEIPLPPLHWYRWPNSGTGIISNGCHWIDHFLYLNNFSSPIRKSVQVRDRKSVV